MQNLNHPHVVRYIEAYEDPQILYLVMELCKGGELEGLIEQYKKDEKPVPEDLASKVFGKLL